MTAGVARGKQKIILGMFDLHFQVVLIIVPKGTRPECQVFFVIGVDIGCSHSWINTEKIVQYIASKQAVWKHFLKLMILGFGFEANFLDFINCTLLWTLTHGKVFGIWYTPFYILLVCIPAAI